MQPTYTKLDDDKFEITLPSTEQVSVAAVQDEIAQFQKNIDDRVTLLQGAVIAGVANAQPALDTIAAAPLSATLAKVAPLSATIAQPTQLDAPAQLN